MVVYQLLTLRMPFQSRNLGGLICNIMASKFDPQAAVELQRRAGELPPALAHLVSSEGALHSSPDQRITIDEVVRQFPLLDELREETEETPQLDHSAS